MGEVAGYRHGHLPAVLRLLHDRHRISPAERCRSRSPPGEPRPVQPVDQALGREQRGLDPADMGRHVAGQRVHPALAARAPEHGIEREAGRGGRAVGGAGGLRGEIGEQRRLGVQEERQLVVEPGRVELRGPGDVEPAALEAAEVEQHADPGQQRIHVVVRVPDRSLGAVAARRPGAPPPGRQAGVDGEAAEVGEAPGRPRRVDQPGRLPDPERRGRCAGSASRRGRSARTGWACRARRRRCRSGSGRS